MPTEKEGFTIEAFIGGLAHHGLIDRKGTLDPTQVGADVAGPYHEHFYAVWESIVRCQNGVARINLLLNRASPWLDVDSYLPYEGRVVIRNKTADTMAVRIPAWVDRGQVGCTVDGKDAVVQWLGNYVLLQGLNHQAVVTIYFSMKETTEEYYLTGFSGDWQWYQKKNELPHYVFTFKGNTCIKAEFPNRDKFQVMGADREGYHLFQRDHFKAAKAPMKSATRYVAPRPERYGRSARSI